MFHVTASTRSWSVTKGSGLSKTAPLISLFAHFNTAESCYVSLERQKLTRAIHSFHSLEVSVYL